MTPSDTTVIPNCRALYVGETGDLVVDMKDEGTDIVYSNVPAGFILPIEVIRVKLATTASEIVAIS